MPAKGRLDVFSRSRTNAEIGTSTRENQWGRQTIQVALKDILPHPQHPYTIVQDEAFEELCNDIRENGLFTPVLVRTHPQQPGKYELIAGYHRLEAVRLAGRDRIVCQVREMNDDEALIAINSTNRQRGLNERDPIQRAKAYQQEMEAVERMRKQGRQPEVFLQSLHQTGSNEEKRAIAMSRFSVAGRTGTRYIRLLELIPPFQQSVSEGKIGINAGEQLSYLQKEEQQQLYEYLSRNNYKIGTKIAEALRCLSQEQKWTATGMEHCFQTEEAPRLSKYVKLPRKKLPDHLKEVPEKELILLIVDMF